MKGQGEKDSDPPIISFNAIALYCTKKELTMMGSPRNINTLIWKLDGTFKSDLKDLFIMGVGIKVFVASGCLLTCADLVALG